MFGGQDRRFLAAQDRDEVRGAHLDEVDRIVGRRRPGLVRPALEAERAVVVDVDARTRVPVVL